MLHIATFLGIDSGRAVGQAVVDGIVAGSAYGLLGVGFALILGVTGRFHFAYGIIYAFTAYIAAVAGDDWGLPLIPAVLVGLCTATVLGTLTEAIVYRPLADRAGDNALLGVFVASLGLVIAGENAIRLIWGNDTRPLPGFPDHAYTVAQLNITLIQIVQVAAAILLVVATALVLSQTIAGQQIRAVRGNAEMAQAVGVAVRRVFALVFAIGTLLAGVAAVFAGMRFAVTPDMGNTPVFYGFVVAFVAGTQRSPLVIGAVGLLIGVIESLSTLWVSDNLSALTVFGLLFVVLSVRSVPNGVRQLSGSLSPTHRTRTRSARAA